MKNIDGRTKLIAIFGHPVEHSKSPCMHNALFDKLKINAAYVPLSPDPSLLGEAVAGFRALGFLGANVTIPFKEKVGKYLDGLSDISQFTHSVNTLYWENGIIGGKLLGTTTDPYGALANLSEHGFSVKNSHVALLGNGGAARAIAFALIKEGAFVTIVSRSAEKGASLASDLSLAFPDKPETRNILFTDFSLIAHDVNLVLNATSVGMFPNINESPLPKDVLASHFAVCDIVYNPIKTKLLCEAENVGCKIIGGSAMLVYQGAKSFEFWFKDQKADVELMKLAIGLVEDL